MKDYESRQDMLKDLLRPGATLAEIGVFVGEFSDWMAKTLRLMIIYKNLKMKVSGLMGLLISC